MAGEESVLIALLFSGALFLMALGWLISITQKAKREKTFIYRKNINDFIIVGKLRQLAEKHKVDIDKEHLLYKKFMDTEKTKSKDIDDKIEESMNKELEKEMEDKKK